MAGGVTVSARRDGADPGILWTDSAEGLRAIRQRAVRLVVWNKAVPADLRRSLPPDARGLPVGRFAVPAGAVRAALAGIFAGTQPALASALARLAEGFAAALGALQLDLRLECVRHDSCRLFHVDHVPARLIATFIGPGTEYLPEAAVRRNGLGKGGNGRICRDWSAVRRLPAGAAGLFKGALSAEGAGSAAVHRSPPVAAEGATRYLAVIQASPSI